MTRFRLAYVHEFTDRHGKTRRYFRRDGRRIALPGIPGSEEFMQAYKEALAGVIVARSDIGADRTRPGTVNAVIVGYYNSLAFRSLAPATQSSRRTILERFRIENGEKRIATLPRDCIARILSNKKPEAARNWLKAFRGLLRFAVAEGFRSDDPTADIKAKKPKTDGYAPWTDDLIAKFRKHHAIGTRARLALELLLNTGLRRSDTIRMGRQHVKNGVLSIRQQKTGNLVEIPVLPDLQSSLAAMPNSDRLTFLTTDTGKGFTGTYFSNWFQVQCDAADIPRGYSAHGLRKAAATAHANKGATAHELMAWFGWNTLAEAERYTRAANRRHLAQGMAAKLAT